VVNQPSAAVNLSRFAVAREIQSKQWEDFTLLAAAPTCTIKKSMLGDGETSK